MVAAMHRNLRMVIRLIAKGAAVWAIDKVGRTAADYLQLLPPSERTVTLSTSDFQRNGSEILLLLQKTIAKTESMQQRRAAQHRYGDEGDEGGEGQGQDYVVDIYCREMPMDVQEEGAAGAAAEAGAGGRGGAAGNCHNMVVVHNLPMPLCQ